MLQIMGRTTTGSQRPPVYISSPLGFTESGQLWYEQVLLPDLDRAGFTVRDPWRTEAGTASEEIFAEIPESLPDAHQQLWEINIAIAQRNVRLVTESSAVLAVLDGPDIDSGVACEIGYATAIGKPVVGLRTDRRRAGDNPGTTVNLQVQWAILASGGDLCTSLRDAIVALQKLCHLHAEATDGHR